MAKEMNESTTDLEVELVSETDKAILVKSEFDKEVWLPKKLLLFFKDNKDGTCVITVTDRIAVDKELV